MRYLSTRGDERLVSSARAITSGIAPDGGLYVPEQIPVINEEDWASLLTMSYQEQALYILGKYLSDFSIDQCQHCVQGAYHTGNFDHADIAPLFNIRDHIYSLELWHGPTCAFKDMALQILPYLMTTSAAIIGESNDIVILVATSGDTGKAALEGFQNVDGTHIIVFFPEEGVSEVQKRQMVTQQGNNVHVVAVKGNFDDAQNGVKRIFGDVVCQQRMQQRGCKMSSANSINWGRLLPQIIYYLSAYVNLRKNQRIQVGEKINVVVPTGNFGNILAAYYAREMGVPIQRLICASNANNVLTQFIHSGTYDRRRPFHKTISPSMDILISSNLERLLFELSEHDDVAVRGWMEKLSQQGHYQVDDEILQRIQSIFWAGFADDDQTQATIRQVWQQDAYLMDTHTAVAMHVYEDYLHQTGDNTVTVIASTASPFKFASSVAAAIIDSAELVGKNEFDIIKLLALKTEMAIPAGIRDLEQKPVLHHQVCTPQEMASKVFELIEIA